LDEQRIPAARVDLNRTIGDPDGLRVDVLAALRKAVAAVGSVPKLRLLSPSGQPRSDARDARRYWLADAERLLDTCGRAVLVVDEIDTVLPTTGHGDQTSIEMISVLAQLRGLCQERSAGGQPGLV